MTMHTEVIIRARTIDTNLCGLKKRDLCKLSYYSLDWFHARFVSLRRTVAVISHKKIP